MRTMAAEDEEATAGHKREREDDADAADHEEAPAAKEARVDGGDGGGGAEAAGAGAGAGGDATAADAEDAAAAAAVAADDDDAAPAEEEQPNAVDQLAEALEMLAPAVTKRLDTLHASGLVLEEEIDATTLLLLGEFTPKVAVEIIDSMTKENLEGVENKSAYMQEVMARFKGAPSAPAPGMHLGGVGGVVGVGGQTGGLAPPPAMAMAPAALGEPIQLQNGQTLPASVSGALQQLWASGAVTQSQIDERMLEYLAGMHENAARLSVEELSRANLDGIRNISAYFKTICRRHQMNSGGGVGGGGHAQGGGGGFQGGGMSGPPPPEAFYEIQRHYQMGVITQPVAMRLEQFFNDTGASLDRGAWEIMLQLNEMSAMAAIEEVHGACRSDKPVRNPSAYFTGIARKHLAGMVGPPGGGFHGHGGGGGPGGFHGGGGAPGGYPGVGGGGGGGFGGGGRGGGPVDDSVLQQQLPPQVFQRIAGAVNRGKFDRSALDQRALTTLLQLDEVTACVVIDEIEQTDLSRIRNFAAYFMGICNKFLKGSGGPPQQQQRF